MNWFLCLFSREKCNFSCAKKKRTAQYYSFFTNFCPLQIRSVSKQKHHLNVKYQCFILEIFTVSLFQTSRMGHSAIFLKTIPYSQFFSDSTKNEFWICNILAGKGGDAVRVHLQLKSSQGLNLKVHMRLCIYMGSVEFHVLSRYLREK